MLITQLSNITYGYMYMYRDFFLQQRTGMASKEQKTFKDYANANFDPCREWLRMLVVVICVCMAVALVYPIHLSVVCLEDALELDGDTLNQCNLLDTSTKAAVALSIAILGQVILLILFFFACRHEFCGCKRRYERPLAEALCCTPQIQPSQG